MKHSDNDSEADAGSQIFAVKGDAEQTTLWSELTTLVDKSLW